MIKRIWNFCKLTIQASPIFFILNVVQNFILVFACLGSSYAFKLLTDKVLALRGNTSSAISVISPILLFFFMICIGGNTNNIQQMFSTMFVNKAKKLFHKYFIFRSYQEEQDSFYDNNFYDRYTFVKDHIESTTQISITIFNTLLNAILGLIVFSVTISVFSISVLIFILIVAITMIFINRYIVKQRVKLNEDYIKEERKARYYSELLASKGHAKELRIFRLRNYFLKLWNNSFQNYSVGKYQFEKKALILGNIPNFLNNFFYILLILYFLYLVSIKKLSVGEFGFIYQAIRGITYYMQQIVDILSRELAQDYKYIEKYEAFTKDIKKDNLSQLQNYHPRKFQLSEGNFEKLVLKNIEYSYPNQEGKAIDGLSFHIKKGEVVSILGYNGSGKSTLSKIMCGILKNYQGEVFLNDKNIKDMDLEEISKYFGIGFQDFTRYSLTLRENIGFGMIEKMEEKKELEKAIKKGNLEEIIEHLPQGIDSIIGKEYDETGQDMSGGQWQRVILARAYMGEPEILLLDEPTASIDPIEEMRMLSQLKEILNGKTALLISHRIGFARLSDRICIMEQGKIVEEGSHEELLNLHGRYYELFMAQKNLYQDDTEVKKKSLNKK